MKIQQEEPLGERPTGDQGPPDLSVRMLVPKIPGLDTKQLENWDWREANKKGFYLRCAKIDASQVQELYNIAKENDILVHFWECYVKVSNVVPTRGKRKRESKIEEVGQLVLKKYKRYISTLCGTSNTVPAWCHMAWWESLT